jgi:hypothetical protein
VEHPHPRPRTGLERLDPLQQRLLRRIQLRPRGPQQRQLDGHPRLVPLANRGERCGDRVNRPHQPQVAERIGLRAQPLGVGRRHREVVDHVVGRPDHEQLTEVSQQVAPELGRVAPGARKALGRLEHSPAIAGGDRISSGEDQLGLGDAEHGKYILGRYALAAVGDELVERADGIAKASGGGPRDRGDGAIVDLDLLRGGDAADDLRDLIERGPLEVETLAAIDDRRHHLVGLGGGQHERCVRRRLLERLQEGVPRLPREHVRLVEDVDLPAPCRWCVADALAQVADVLHRAVRGGVHLDHVHRAPGGDRHTRLALPAGRHGGAVDAVERAGQDLRHGGLPRPPRPHEEVGVMDAIALHRVAKGADDVLLPHDLVEGLRAVTAIERGCGGHSIRVYPRVQRRPDRKAPPRFSSTGARP